MKDETPNLETSSQSPTDLSRREFVALSVAGLAAAAGSVSAAELPVVEQNVEIKTPTARATPPSFIPTTGSHPGVLIWPDAFGLRPSMRDMAKRLAAEGYSVLVPNPFYRVAEGAGLSDASSISASRITADMAKLRPLMASVNAEGAAEKDAVALHRVPRCAEAGEQGEEDRHAGLLHGRTAGREDCAPPCRTASARARRSTAAAWSPTSRTARICSRRRSRRGCTSASRRTTTRASRTRRTS